MRGERRPAPPSAAPFADEGRGLRVCINIPGLNRAASQELLWPSRMGRCEGPPHSYVRMPFGLLNSAARYQRHMRGILAAHEARRQEVLAGGAPIPRESPGPQETREPQELGGS
jgi:hypothetical protein